MKLADGAASGCSCFISRPTREGWGVELGAERFKKGTQLDWPGQIANVKAMGKVDGGDRRGGQAIRLTNAYYAYKFHFLFLTVIGIFQV